jgi:predicted ester cyclase
MSDRLRELTKRIVKMFDTGDVSDASLLGAAGYADHQGLSGVEIFGPEGFARVVTSARNSCRELAVQIEDLIAEADRVAIRLHWRGTVSAAPPNTNQIAKVFE